MSEQSGNGDVLHWATLQWRKGTGFHFNSLKHKVLWDLDLLEQQKSPRIWNRQMRLWRFRRCKRFQSGIYSCKYLETKVCSPELNHVASASHVFCLSGPETQNLVSLLYLLWNADFGLAASAVVTRQHQSTFGNVLNTCYKQDGKRLNYHACIHLYVNSCMCVNYSKTILNYCIINCKLEAKVQKQTLMLAWERQHGQPWGKRARSLVCPLFLSCPGHKRKKKRSTTVIVSVIFSCRYLLFCILTVTAGQ